MAESKQTGAVPVEHITQSILVLRGHKVLLDAELAGLYGVSTKRFNEQVRRNRERFPADFMFQLTAEEHAALRSQFATSKPSATEGRGGRRYLPHAFTEHGAIQASNVLSTPRAVAMGVYVVRAFVQLRESRRRDYSRSGYGPLPPSAMNRSIRAVSTGSGTDPNCSTVSWKARMLNFGPNAFSAFARSPRISRSPR